VGVFLDVAEYLGPQSGMDWGINCMTADAANRFQFNVTNAFAEMSVSLYL